MSSSGSAVSGLAASFASASRIIAVIVFGAGCSVLLGWVFDITTLKNVAPGFATMKANTALCFALAGLSLFILGDEDRAKWRRYGSVSAFLILLISLLTILQYSTGWELGIDQLLFRDIPVAGAAPVPPGRMAPATALSFLLLGIALILLDSKHGSWLRESLVLLATLNSALAMIGYLYGVNSLYSMVHFSSVALHSAAFSFLLSLGVLFARPTRGVMAIVSGDTTGGIVVRRLLPVSLILLVVFGLLRLLGQRGGLYETEFGLSLFVVTMASALTALILWTGATISRIDSRRSTAETALRESEETYRILFESNPHPMWVYDVETLAFLAVNDAAVAHYGYSEDEFLSMTIMDIRPSEDVPAVLEAVRALSPHLTSTVYRRHRKKDGSLIEVEGTSRELEIGGRRARLVLATDVTERKRAQSELQQSEERYRTVTETASDAMITIDEDSRILLINRAAERTFGYTADEMLGKQLTMLMPEALRDIHRVGLKRYVTYGEKHITWDGTELPGLHKSGREMPLEVSFGEFTKNGRRFFTGIVRDITERKRTDEILRSTNQTLQSLIETSPLAIIALDRDLVVTTWNPAAERIFGWSENEVIGRPYPIVPEGKTSEQDAVLGALRRGEFSANMISQRRRKDGSLVDVSISSAAQRDDRGEMSGVVTVIADITEQKSLEDQLRQAQKMEAVGQLAGGVAHDFNNLLTVILGYCNLASNRGDDPEGVRKDLAFIKHAGDRATRLVAQLLAFSRKQVLQPRILDLNELVADTEKMLRRLISEDIDLITITRPGLGHVLADAGQIEQIILNLAINARDAMPNGGKLTIETDNVELDESYCRAHADVSPGRYVLVAVSDTGHGIDHETQTRIFEPFFTTKERGKGTGLGLSTVFGIVKQSGGHIWLYSEPEKGATFKVYLPRVDDPVGSVEAATGTVESLRGSETILLAEDDDAVRRLARMVLEMYGYKVLESASGPEAIEIAKRARGIALLVTDVVMPRMSGKELALEVRDLMPHVPVLYLSGYTEDAIVQHGVLDEGVAFLPKPFTPDALARKVREVLDNSKA